MYCRINRFRSDQTVFDIDQMTDIASGIRGHLLLAGDHGYDQARQIWNGIFDKKPAIIMRFPGTSDVVRAVNFARANRLLFSLKEAAVTTRPALLFAKGGFMIDLSPIRRTMVDGEKIARVDGGALMGDLVQETLLYGLVVSAGIVSHTGVGGLALEGGVGQSQRRHVCR